MTGAEEPDELVRDHPWEVLDALGDAVAVFGPDGRMVWENVAAKRLFAELEETMDGGPFGDVAWGAVGPDGQRMPTDRLPVEVTRTSAVPVRDQVVGFPAADRTTRWLRTTTRRLHRSSGLPCTVVASFADETAEHAGTEDLRRELELQRSTLDDLPVGVVVQDRYSVFVLTTARARELLGLTADQLAGRTPMDPDWGTVDPDGAPLKGADRPPQLALRTGEQQRRIVGVRLRDEPVRWLRVTSRPRLDDEDRVDGVVSTYLDVTGTDEAPGTAPA